ncbi:hypothetical protein DFO73_11634 [Cytobacillus oceanisediminis]|uniref:DUF2726 domain-containing protein n=1 Tax=Cytobacillus oceanisediminis TaxID=665099 RepID=A0A2V2ZPZ2_9BACI|nr:hypothetical protein [Cytobacillus oceanisediminis]PWW20220.1 hypothetical protein DFO73_11634 [Cytobacillus oceanisediminis]
MVKTWKLEEVKEEFKNVGLKLLSKSYISSKELMDYECLKCGHIDKKSFSKVYYRKQGCKKCGKKKAGVSKRLSINTVREELIKKNLRLLSTDYVKRTEPLEYECIICQKKDKRTYATIIQGEYGCIFCGEVMKRKNLLKYTIEDAKEIFKQAGLLLTEKEYKNFNEEMSYECIDCGYKDKKSLSVAKVGKGCPKCAGILPLDLNEVRNLFSENQLLLKENEYANARTPMKYLCLVCGYIGDKTVSNLRAGKGCKKCANIQNANNQRLLYTDVKKIIQGKGWKLVSETYESNRATIELRCPAGHEVFMNLNNFNSDKGCRKCSGLEKPSLDVRKSVFLNLNLKLLDNEYKNSNTPLTYECQECGYIGYKTYKSAKNGFGCLACSPASAGEEKIANWLIDKGIHHIRQYRISECRNNKPLPFDFAVFNKLNQLLYLVEFDGEQHFRAREYFGGEQSFLKRLENDEIKNKFCSANNIPLLRISYLEINEVENILSKQLLPLLVRYLKRIGDKNEST